MLRKHGERQVAHVGYPDDRGILFADTTGDYIRSNLASRNVHNRGQRVGHRGMTAHSLRHFHVSILLPAGFHEALPGSDILGGGCLNQNNKDEHCDTD